jgi:Leucine-rich repeat (LRR) protein
VRERLIAVSNGTSTVLDLEHTDLKLVPAAIGVLGARVEIMVLAGNDQVTSLPPAIAALQSLRLLDVDGCRLSALPASLCFLSSLQSLYANDNRLTSLPGSFGHLRSLRELRLSGNALGGTEDPIAPIARLPSLSVLWLARNALTSLPTSVCTLGRLKELDLDGNALEELPAALLSGMRQLEELTLEGNPLEWPPAAMAKLGLAAMRTWHAAHARPEQPLPREIQYGHEPEGSMHAPSGVKGFRTNAAGGEFIFPRAL